MRISDTAPVAVPPFCEHRGRTLKLDPRRKQLSILCKAEEVQPGIERSSEDLFSEGLDLARVTASSNDVTMLSPRSLQDDVECADLT